MYEKANSKADLSELKADVAELKALLTPECTANRLARAQGLGTVPGAGPSNANAPPGKKVSAAAIAVPTVLVLVLAAVGVTVAMMKSRGNANAAAYQAANLRPPAAKPSTDQTNPAFTPADAAAVSIPEPGAAEGSQC